MSVAAGPDRPAFTSVLAMGELAQSLAYAWGMAGHSSGNSTWTTRTYHPGRMPGMATGPFGQAVVHTLTPRAPGQARVDWLAAQQLAVEEDGEMLSSWTQAHLPDSVIVGIPRGFLPVTLSRLGSLPPPMTCRPMVHTGTSSGN